MRKRKHPFLFLDYSIKNWSCQISSRLEIEDYLNSYYDLEKPCKDSWDYKLTIKYTTEENLDSEIEEIIYEMANIADMRNCFIEHSITSEKLDKSW